MKKFSFPLHRVLEWKQARLSVAQARLQELDVRAREAVLALAELDDEIARTGEELRAAVSANGARFESASRYLAAGQQRRRNLVEQRRCAERDAQQQQRVVTDCHRDCRLLEMLRERNLAQWQVEYEKSQETLAAESHRALQQRRTGKGDAL